MAGHGRRRRRARPRGAGPWSPSPALAVAAVRRVPCVAQTHGMVEPRTALPVRLFDLLYLPLLRAGARLLRPDRATSAGW
ncbi:hypothetical protein LT493_12310 [Streptomyces tricolor]|nr:hypothetical protein [Streptomyces tricolor]